MDCKAPAPFVNLALFEPEIAPNTGNLIRLCANCGARLELIHPLGFELDDKRLRRAGLDYAEFSQVVEHENFDAFIKAPSRGKVYACSTKGSVRHDEIPFQIGDTLLMGPETRGLPEQIRNHPKIEAVVRLPMRKDSRSLNLSNAAAILVYEVWRQLGFPGDQQ